MAEQISALSANKNKTTLLYFYTKELRQCTLAPLSFLVGNFRIDERDT
jgi:hypothetical protein